MNLIASYCTGSDGLIEDFGQALVSGLALQNQYVDKIVRDSRGFGTRKKRHPFNNTLVFDKGNHDDLHSSQRVASKKLGVQRGVIQIVTLL